MLATTVRIQTKQKHPNADSLFIYTVSNFQSINNVQVVANSENIYEVGDIAYFTVVGSVLLDGTKISKRKIRDVMSYGMLMGKADEPVAIDVTAKFCKLPEEVVVVDKVKLPFQKWTSIKRFENNVSAITKSISKGFNSPAYKSIYKGKVKLHGTNAAIQVTPDGKVVAQKRTSVIYPDQDNQGFATWVEQNKEYFQSLQVTEAITIHGEWCGPKIQKGVACSSVEEKFFAVFAIQFGRNDLNQATYEVEPIVIENILGSDGPCYILCWADTVELDFYNYIDLKIKAQEIQKRVIEVEECDPWVELIFGVKGVGEGLVYYPWLNERLTDEDLQYLFKAKGGKHQAKSTKQVVAVDIEKLENVQEFVNMFVTPNRLEQGLCEACQGDADIKYIGTFLSWMSNDVQKESKDELEKSGLAWKDVRKPVMTTAKQWYQQQI